MASLPSVVFPQQELPLQSSTGRSSSATSLDPLSQAREELRSYGPAQAEATVRSYLVSSPTSANAHFLLGYILFRKVQTHAADAADLTDAVRQKSFVAMREENTRESLAEYTEGARYHTPGSFDLKIVALDYVLLGDYPDADKWMLKSLAWDPQDEQSWYYEGRIKYKQAQYAQALEAFQHALRLSPQDVSAEENLGLAFQGLEKTPEAVDAFQQAIRWARAATVPEDGPWVDLGSLLIDMGRAPEATPYLAEAVRIAPNDVRARETLAAAYRASEQWPAAQRELEVAVKLSPDTASLHFMLGQAFRRNGEPEKANAEMQKSAALEAENQAAARASEKH